MEINKVSLFGRLAADPKVAPARSDTDRRAVSFSLAVASSYRDQNGRWIEHVNYFWIRLYGQPAEFAAQHLRKGSEVYLDGALRAEKIKDVDGPIQYRTVVVVTNPGAVQLVARTGVQPTVAQSHVLSAETNATNAHPKVETQTASTDSASQLDPASAEFEAAHGLQAVPF